jgi:multifunctional 2-oxoglutarate metabolism enzyme
LYPWPEDQIADILTSYEHATDVMWVQEEPENMGGWTFVHSRLHRLLRDDFTLRHVARTPSGSPAAGSLALHQLEHDDLIERAFS